jgi:hypothetical protein
VSNPHDDHPIIQIEMLESDATKEEMIEKINEVILNFNNHYHAHKPYNTHTGLPRTLNGAAMIINPGEPDD